MLTNFLPLSKTHSLIQNCCYYFLNNITHRYCFTTKHNLVNHFLFRLLSGPWVPFSCSVVSDSLRPHESQHGRPPSPSQLQEFTQTHVHRVGDAIQDLIVCCPLLLLPTIPPRIRVFSNESTLLMSGQVLEFQYQHQSFQWTPRTDLL